jgi:hypothetical protein
MSNDSNVIKIRNAGTNSRPRYKYGTNPGNEKDVGTLAMYNTFVLNFSDSNISNNVFSSPEGNKLLEEFLTTYKCSLYDNTETSTVEYHKIIQQAFGIISVFLSGLKDSGSTKKTYGFYFSLIAKINLKRNNYEKYPIISNSLESVVNSIQTKFLKLDIVDFNKIEIKQGSVESVKEAILRSVVIDNNTKNYLSPIDPSVFNDFREYCKKYIGEGTKLAEESKTENERKKTKLLRAIGILYKETGITNPNSNNIIDVNKVLIYFLNHIDQMRKFIKIMEYLIIYYENEISNFEILKNIWPEDDTPFIIENFSERSYIGNTNITRNGKIFEIPIAVIKFVLKILNDNINPSSTGEIKKETENDLKSILNYTFGDIKTEIKLDWWQKDFLEYVKERKSFILVGDTSGGKTFISLLGMKNIFNTFFNEKDSVFIYIAPTPQLVILQFSNILKAYPDYTRFFGICSKLIVDIPPTARILFGTPNEIKKYLRKVNFTRNTSINNDNIKSQTTNAINNPFISNCKILIIDEIQTWSPTYVQDIEIEQTMECKAIEEIIKTVSFDKDKNSQIIGLSATLSEHSITNIKQKISNITGIRNIYDIRYSHRDIGLSDKNDMEKYIPIMKKPELIPIKLENRTVTSFEKDETIYSQELNNPAIEYIIRDASVKNVLPISFYRESEMITIQMYKDFISYLEQCNSNCVVWGDLYKRYNTEKLSSGKDIMNDIGQIDKWKEILNEKINELNNISITNSIIMNEKHSKIINDYYNANKLGKGKFQNLSIELYGVIYEWVQINNGKIPFTIDIHPYYRFASVANTDNFFNLVSSDGKDTYLKKILLAQDADPNSNAGSIIPLIMRGISFGVSLITSSIPLGFQLEIFRYINVKSKSSNDFIPIPITFCEFGMATGVNFSTMSVCIMRSILSLIGISEFNQIGGRPGRRGNANTRAPVIYTFNIENANEMHSNYEDLDFDVDGTNSYFFNPNEVYDYICRLVLKYENNKEDIIKKVETLSDRIISADCFKEIGGDDMLLVRKNQLAKYQIRELFDTCKNLFPDIISRQLKDIFDFLQKAEFYNLNVQIS